MKTRTFLVMCVAALAGCSSSQRGAVLSAEPGVRPQANLALGPSAQHLRLAELWATRSNWPAVDRGYRQSDVTYYTRVHYDTQSYYDRYGSLYHETQTVQTGTWWR